MTSERKPRPSFRLVQCPVIYDVFAHLDFEGLTGRFDLPDLVWQVQRLQEDRPSVFANGENVGTCICLNYIPEQRAIAFRGTVRGDRLANRAVLVEPLRIVPLFDTAVPSGVGYRPSKLPEDLLPRKVDSEDLVYLKIKGFELLHAGKSRGRIAARPEGRRR